MVDPTIRFAHNPGVIGVPRPLQHIRQVVTDPDEFADALSSTTLEVDFLTSQVIPARYERFQGATWALDLGEIHGKARARAPLPPGWAFLGLMRGSGSSIWHGMKTSPGTLVCHPPGTEGPDGQVTAGFAWASIAVPTNLWETCQVIAGAELSVGEHDRVRSWQMPPLLFASVERQLRDTHKLLESALVSSDLLPFAERAALNFVTNIATYMCRTIGSYRPFPSSTARNRAYLARRAERWMRDRLGDAIRVPDVCLALHVSRRELEYAFRSSFDTSPQNFLNTLRLNAIHRALLRADSTNSITRLAFDHGITHLGRFAAAYRLLFGHNPSDTLRERGAENDSAYVTRFQSKGTC